ncbi:MAG: 50S ribosomal protein L18 [Bacteroidales bacterium]|nr:50S ribosomal protein L18 [Bacteroidales bacterium]MBN2757380.1 50S ribosomal protein L18 [Bacteroidales bacterium]
MALTKQANRLKIKRRIRKNILGTKEKPRMSVYRSNKNIFVQIIDDIDGVTFVSASSLSKDISEKKEITKKEQASIVGKLIAEKAIQAGIKEVVFDRNGYLYHGRVKTLADAARENGLKL